MDCYRYEKGSTCFILSSKSGVYNAWYMEDAEETLNEIKQMDQSREESRFVCSSMPADNKYNRNKGYSPTASFFYIEKKHSSRATNSLYKANSESLPALCFTLLKLQLPDTDQALKVISHNEKMSMSY